MQDGDRLRKVLKWVIAIALAGVLTASVARGEDRATDTSRNPARSHRVPDGR